jgi:tetratricopeptide (TPR) repeat protein
MARKIGDRQGEGSALTNLGLAYASLGEVQKAVGYFEQWLVIAREIGDRQGECGALGNLSRTRLGEELAKALLEQARAIGEQIQDPQIV